MPMARLGGPIYFSAGGSQKVRVQVREDGVSVDHIVLSAANYWNTSPGTTMNDTRSEQSWRATGFRSSRTPSVQRRTACGFRGRLGSELPVLPVSTGFGTDFAESDACPTQTQV
jgi:hypothetical protein